MKRSLLAVVVLVMLVGPVGAARADAPQVTLVTPSGTQHALALEALAGGEDVVGRQYPLRSSTGETTATVTGFSIGALLDAAGIDPYGFSYLEVQRPGGGSVQLSSAQALAEPPPVVYATPTGTAFLRPSPGSGDDNSADSFEAPQGVTIALRKGASLQVRLEASPRKTTVGKKVSFRAVVERAGSGEGLSYHWYFDDGGSGEGESVEHSYAKPGSYSVVVGVKAAGEETGTSAVVRIQVGEPAAGGPNRKGGGTNKAKAAPDHGAARGPSGAASSSPPAAAPTSRRPQPTTKAKPDPSKAPSKKTAPAPTREAAGEEIAGELLEGEVEAKPETAEPRKHVAARTGTPQSAGAGDGVPTAAWGIGAVIALLAGGALAEAGAFTDLIPRLRERLR